MVVLELRLLANAVRRRIPTSSTQALVVNGQPLTIVGVAPRGLRGHDARPRPQVFVPMTLRDDDGVGVRKGSLENRRAYWAYAFARLKPGVTLEQALAAINVPYSARS